MAKSGFRGNMGGGGMNMNMMKQAQKMQQELMKMQEEMENKTFSFTAGGGMVTATVTGKHRITELTIDPEAVDPDDVEMLEDMIIAAINGALNKGEEDTNASMSKLTGGMNMGGLGGLL